MDGTITCEGVRIGGVPKDADLSALAEQGVKTLVDVRETDEAASDGLEAKAKTLGLRYLHVPISKRRVDIGQIDTFKAAIADAGKGHVYAFSSSGKRPAGILCFLACAREGDSVIEVFHKAKNCGCPIDKEFALKKFILDFYSSHRGDMLNNHFHHQPV